MWWLRIMSMGSENRVVFLFIFPMNSDCLLKVNDYKHWKWPHFPEVRIPLQPAPMWGMMKECEKTITRVITSMCSTVWLLKPKVFHFRALTGRRPGNRPYIYWSSKSVYVRIQGPIFLQTPYLKLEMHCSLHSVMKGSCGIAFDSMSLSNGTHACTVSSTCLIYVIYPSRESACFHT